MKLEEAKKFIDNIIKEAEKIGVDHHSVNKVRKGSQQYLEIDLSIKLTELPNKEM